MRRSLPRLAFLTLALALSACAAPQPRGTWGQPLQQQEVRPPEERCILGRLDGLQRAALTDFSQLAVVDPTGATRSVTASQRAALQCKGADVAKVLNLQDRQPGVWELVLAY